MFNGESVDEGIVFVVFVFIVLSLNGFFIVIEGLSVG